MAAKDVKFGSDARERMLRGVDILANAVGVTLGGKSQEAKHVNVAAAQATALVIGIMKADGGKRLKKFAKLIGDLYKRDSLPDVDKSIGWKKGKAVEAAERAMDAAHGRDAEGKK